MIRPFDKDHAELAEMGGCITYVRGLTPEKVAIRLGGRLENFTPATFYELYGGSRSGARLGITVVGDWVMIVEMAGTKLGITSDIVTRLSAGTRFVSHYCLAVKALDYFYWLEDGELRFCFVAQDGCMEPVPEEFAEIMNEIEARYPPLVHLHMGPMFLMAERLTGIKLTPRLLEEATYLCGVVSEPEWDIMGW
ncbi:hypothetical protein FXF51_35865 [Nonomuraea sp. PA05]|uniref:DUF6461 domain-containing protein n=1 Tax=Nonomuraea sp. PA05 TaxID=2604466 RepID=UPI0011D74197|nr:DUF6461 domain-containing protein [Nonomuraea sp. PA05]TYB58906.1 hypothetical protein FXF51_35865 [Nonomuraea sp. PA05]